MSGGAEMIAGAVVQHVASMLGDIAWERIQLLWNFKEDVEEMESKMTDLKVALSYANKRSRETDGDELVLHWLNKYKSVAYDMEDTLDELFANAMIWENSPCTVGGYCQQGKFTKLRQLDRKSKSGCLCTYFPRLHMLLTPLPDFILQSYPEEIKRGYLAQKHAPLVAKNLRLSIKGSCNSKLEIYITGFLLALVSLGRNERVGSVAVHHSQWLLTRLD